ncbi:MAG TPA: hypothetical protein PKE47_16240, partial [Verrucomicrobiota bacterium]|nr:hypothetical protein [Verrucomicrobiota bacterium]
DPRQREAWARGFIPPRPPGLPEGPLDLTPLYNASLNRSPFPGDTDWEAEMNSLAALPSGHQTWFGLPFDVRGIVQLDSREARRRFGRLLPPAVRGIPVGRKFRHLHIVHAAHWPSPDGTEVAQYRVRYADGGTAAARVRFGREIHGGWRQADEPIPAPAAARIVWRGRNPVADRAGYAVVVYLMSWENPRPDETAATLELVSAMTDSSVGVVAVTAG